MRLRYAILLSLLVHLLAVSPPLPWSSKTSPSERPRITVTIEPLTPTEVTAQETPQVANALTRSGSPLIDPQQFQRQAQNAISRQLLYPPEAIERGLEGDVTLLIILDSSGRVQRAEIARSSGHALLDAAAVSAAQGLGRLPGNARESLVPISFRLDE